MTLSLPVVQKNLHNQQRCPYNINLHHRSFTITFLARVSYKRKPVKKNIPLPFIKKTTNFASNNKNNTHTIQIYDTQDNTLVLGQRGSVSCRDKGMPGLMEATSSRVRD